MRRESGVQVHSLKLVAKQQMLRALVGLECSLWRYTTLGRPKSPTMKAFSFSTSVTDLPGDNTSTHTLSRVWKWVEACHAIRTIQNTTTEWLFMARQTLPSYSDPLHQEKGEQHSCTSTEFQRLNLPGSTDNFSHVLSFIITNCFVLFMTPIPTSHYTRGMHDIMGQAWANS